jgi:hypothetical protein
MAELRPLNVLVDYRYGDRGGWKGACKIFAANVPYELKLANIKEQYRVSRDTAQRWYRAYKQLRGL